MQCIWHWITNFWHDCFSIIIIYSLFLTQYFHHGWTIEGFNHLVLKDKSQAAQRTSIYKVSGHIHYKSSTLLLYWTGPEMLVSLTQPQGFEPVWHIREDGSALCEVYCAWAEMWPCMCASLKLQLPCHPAASSPLVIIQKALDHKDHKIPSEETLIGTNVKSVCVLFPSVSVCLSLSVSPTPRLCLSNRHISHAQ